MKKSILFVLAVILLLLISACQDAVVGKIKGKKGDTGGTGTGGTSCIDNDLDGYGEGCPWGPDCNDGNRNVNPGAAEVCDGVDNNCDGLVDEGLTFDVDNDGYYSFSCSDCDNNNSNINPGATEVCDGVDNNCDGLVDEGNVCTNLPKEFTPDANTKALWHFNELGGQAVDSSGNGVNGNIMGGVIQGVAGKFGTAYNFDGIDDYVKLPGTFLSEGLPKGTVEAWINVASTTTISSASAIIFNRGVAAQSTSLASNVVPDGRLAGHIGGVALLSSTNPIPRDKWVHVALTWNGTRVQYFIDGVLDSSHPVSATVPAGGNISVEIGRDDQNVAFFEGIIDEIRISDVVRY